MNCNKFSKAVSKALTAGTVMLIVTLVLATGAWTASNYKILHVFKNASDGANPYGNLVLDAAGNLYGVTINGGVGGGGVVFKLTPNAHPNPDGCCWTESVLHSFTGEDGAVPYAGLIFDAAGNLYGTTTGGGADNDGVVFKLTPNPDGTWTESVLHSFTGGDGAYPWGPLIFDAVGNLYGMTTLGGADGDGVVFKLTPNPDGTWTESVLHSFTGADGFNEFGSAGLIFDADGNLYGTTVWGGPSWDPGEGGFGAGVVFKLTPNPDETWTESVLFNFICVRLLCGGNPDAGLIFDAAGNLYSTAYGGGADSDGVVFKLTPNPDGTWTESVLYSFTGRDGATPVAGLIFDAAGNLYGTTYYGGSNSRKECGFSGCGVVFKLTPTSRGWTETVLHTFWGYGANPHGGVIMDAAGNLYGTTYAGSGTNNGLVFEITP
jgi:uncharacterized repeat protein (TIGR03803 family)